MRDEGTVKSTTVKGLLTILIAYNSTRITSYRIMQYCIEYCVKWALDFLSPFPTIDLMKHENDTNFKPVYCQLYLSGILKHTAGYVILQNGF